MDATGAGQTDRDDRRTRLPAQPGPLLGREGELAALAALLALPEVRLVTLTGPGGVGKTRLALAAAEARAGAYPDGVTFVALAPVADPALVLPTVARALGLREQPGQPPAERLAEHLADARLLLVLDNLEHLLPAAPHLADLLAACPGLRLLVTSRAALRLRWERVFPVPPLALPAAPRPSADDAGRYAAVQLFVERARAVRADFQLTATNTPAVAEICRRLDGLPLAIELASARVRLLPPQAILARLDRRLALLTGGAQDLPTRQQTLRHTIDWSHNLLARGERALFARLAVFVGGGALAAAETVCGAGVDAPVDVLDGLDALVGQALVRQWEGPDGEAEAMRARHAAYYLALAEEAEPRLTRAERGAWLARLEAEHDNLRAALRWAGERGETERGLRLVGALWWFWYFRGYLREGRDWLGRMLDLDGVSDHPAARAKALLGAGVLAHFQGDEIAAGTLLEEGAGLYRALPDRRSLGFALLYLGLVRMIQGDTPAACAHLEESIALFRGLGDRWGLALATSYRGTVSAQHPGEEATARPFLETGVAMFRDLGDRWGLGAPLYYLGLVIERQGDAALARARFEESLASFRETGDKFRTVIALSSLGALAYSAGEHERAAALHGEALALARELGQRRFVAISLLSLGSVALAAGDGETAARRYRESLAASDPAVGRSEIALAVAGLAAAALAQSQPRRAARLAGAATALRDGEAPPLRFLAYAAPAGDLAAARAALGEAAWGAAYEEGRALPLDQAIDLALEPAPGPEPEAGGPAAAAIPRPTLPAGLTTREAEVLHLVAPGLTDTQVAERLYISPRTVSTHLTSVYNKLGVSTRLAATRFALEHGLA